MDPETRLAKLQKVFFYFIESFQEHFIFFSGTKIKTKKKRIRQK